MFGNTAREVRRGNYWGVHECSDLRSVAMHDVNYVKIALEILVSEFYGCISDFSAALWSAPLLERPVGPLEVDVQP